MIELSKQDKAAIEKCLDALSQANERDPAVQALADLRAVVKNKAVKRKAHKLCRMNLNKPDRRAIAFNTIRDYTISDD